MPRATTTRVAQAATKKPAASATAVKKSSSNRYAGIQLTTRRDVEMDTYTSKRSEQLRQGNISTSFGS